MYQYIDTVPLSTRIDTTEVSVNFLTKVTQVSNEFCNHNLVHAFFRI